MEPHHLTEILRVLRGQCLLLGMALAVDAGQQHHANTDRDGPFHSVVAVGIESFIVKMAMGVNHS